MVNLQVTIALPSIACATSDMIINFIVLCPDIILIALYFKTVKRREVLREVALLWSLCCCNLLNTLQGRITLRSLTTRHVAKLLNYTLKINHGLSHHHVNS